ncbi:protein of unassigned function [Methylobacterium oryzae CBMB20]|uniref:Protein of unassigned function n=1 Tax=Methylobacterium oryzae CBMB20 TaxID=693986 RepID=A0A089NV00_9HYPH|nr:protein of unassigned function [Methylobacterium oryzae CBMB20]
MVGPALSSDAVAVLRVGATRAGVCGLDCDRTLLLRRIPL